MGLGLVVFSFLVSSFPVFLLPSTYRFGLLDKTHADIITEFDHLRRRVLSAITKYISLE